MKMEPRMVKIMAPTAMETASSSVVMPRVLISIAFLDAMADRARRAGPVHPGDRHRVALVGGIGVRRRDAQGARAARQVAEPEAQPVVMDLADVRVLEAPAFAADGDVVESHGGALPDGERGVPDGE